MVLVVQHRKREDTMMYQSGDWCCRQRETGCRWITLPGVLEYFTSRHVSSRRETHVYVIACLAFLSVLETNLDIRRDIKVMYSCMTIEIHLLSVNQMQSLPINGLLDRINHYYPTRSSTNIGIVTPNISKTFSYSNYHNSAHILFRNIPPDFRNVHDDKVYL